jgi:hypothetical protein
MTNNRYAYFMRSIQRIYAASRAEKINSLLNQFSHVSKTDPNVFPIFPTQKIHVKIACRKAKPCLTGVEGEL